MLQQAFDLLELLKTKQWKLATAESCTGGMIVAALTDIPGSSAVVERGFVTYTNEAKTEMLAVPEKLLASHGAVSEEVACAMAKGALAHAPVDVAVAVTGIAGPGGNTEEKPLGTVHIAVAGKQGIVHQHYKFSGMRQEIRQQVMLAALDMLLFYCGDEG